MWLKKKHNALLFLLDAKVKLTKKFIIVHESQIGKWGHMLSPFRFLCPFLPSLPLPMTLTLHSTVILNVSSGPPCFLFPSETQVKAIGVLATTMATATRTSKQQ